MQETLATLRDTLSDWLNKAVAHKHAEAWLALVAFTESSFFLVPPDALLVPLVAGGVQTWVRYVMTTTLFSVLGGVFGYIIGALFFDLFGDAIIQTYGVAEQFAHVQDLFNQNTFWAIFISAFTPIPYKVFTISAGVVGVNLLIFIVASLLGRGLRFAILGWIFSRYGVVMGRILFRYFNLFLILGVIALTLFLVLHF